MAWMPVMDDAKDSAKDGVKTVQPYQVGHGKQGVVALDAAGVFVSLLEQQRDLYARVQDAGQRQAALIERGDTQGLLVVLQERQQLIDGLGELNQQLIPHREAWSQGVEQQPTQRRAMVKSLLDEIQTLLNGILEQDEQDKANLQDRMSQVSGQLKQIGQGAQAARAYGRGGGKDGNGLPSPMARFTDRRGESLWHQSRQPRRRAFKQARSRL